MEKRRMNIDELIPVTEASLHAFRDAKEENKLKAVYMMRWIDYKKRYFSNFLAYAFDKEGNIYRRDFLKGSGWLQVPNFIESDLHGK